MCGVCVCSGCIKLITRKRKSDNASAVTSQHQHNVMKGSDTEEYGHHQHCHTATSNQSTSGDPYCAAGKVIFVQSLFFSTFSRCDKLCPGPHAPAVQADSNASTGGIPDDTAPIMCRQPHEVPHSVSAGGWENGCIAIEEGDEELEVGEADDSEAASAAASVQTEQNNIGGVTQLMMTARELVVTKCVPQLASVQEEQIYCDEYGGCDTDNESQLPCTGSDLCAQGVAFTDASGVGVANVPGGVLPQQAEDVDDKAVLQVEGLCANGNAQHALTNDHVNRVTCIPRKLPPLERDYHEKKPLGKGSKEKGNDHNVALQKSSMMSGEPATRLPSFPMAKPVLKKNISLAGFHAVEKKEITYANKSKPMNVTNCLPASTAMLSPAHASTPTKTHVTAEQDRDAEEDSPLAVTPMFISDTFSHLFRVTSNDINMIIERYRYWLFNFVSL